MVYASWLRGVEFIAEKEPHDWFTMITLPDTAPYAADAPRIDAVRHLILVILSS